MIEMAIVYMYYNIDGVTLLKFLKFWSICVWMCAVRDVL